LRNSLLKISTQAWRRNHPGLKVKATIQFPLHILPMSLTWTRFYLFQNGYPSRRRSLVDDARFETLVVKQTKQTVLEEARSKANGRYLNSNKWVLKTPVKYL